MSLCHLQVISPAGVVHDLQKGLVQVRVRNTKDVFMIVALGNTYGIRAELKGLGFRWDQAHKVWYYFGNSSMSECEFLQGFWTDNFGPSVQFRSFKRTGKVWGPA